MINFAGLHKSQQTITHADGSFSEVITFILPASGLHFSDIQQSERAVCLKESAELRWLKAYKRGEPDALIAAFNRLSADLPLARSFPGLEAATAEGEVLLSTNSFLTYTLRSLFERGWLRLASGRWQSVVPAAQDIWQQRAAACLRLLGPDGILLYRGPLAAAPDEVDFAEEKLDVLHNLAPVDRFGFLQDVFWQKRPHLIFNTSYFLLEDEDFFSHHSGMGEAFNLWVGAGVIHRPPLYRRGAIYRNAAGRWGCAFFDLADLAILLPGGIELIPEALASRETPFSFRLNPEQPGAVSLYTRYFGVETPARRVLGRTPAQPGVLELLVVDRRVVSWKRGGGLQLPQNGFAISFAPGGLPGQAQADLLASLEGDLRIAYRFARPEHAGISEAIQTGPLLVRDGQPNLLNRDVVKEEQFWPSREIDGVRQVGVVPTDFDSMLATSRHPRVGLGVRGDGDLALVMVAGVSKGGGVPGKDSMGATLTELADLLIAAGARQAVNLDGGGSAQALLFGGRAIIPGERRGFDGVSFDRMVPAVGLVDR